MIRLYVLSYPPAIPSLCAVTNIMLQIHVAYGRPRGECVAAADASTGTTPSMSAMGRKRTLGRLLRSPPLLNKGEHSHDHLQAIAELLGLRVIEVCP